MSKRPRRSTEECKARRQEKQPSSSSRAAAIEWPRPEGVPFPLPKHMASKKPDQIAKLASCRNRPFNNVWDDYDSFYYNGLLNVIIEPTKMCDPEFLRGVKWMKPLQELSKALGLGTMLFKSYPLYPDLVHQFLASCRVRIVGNPIASNGSLVFKLDGGCYALTFGEICSIYDFDGGYDGLRIPDRSAILSDLWREISGAPFYNSSTAKHTDIKHPVLRMFLRMISNTLLCKMEPGKMRKTELVLLHFAIGHYFDYADGLDQGHQINFGSVFAHYLEELKDKGLSGTTKVETVGSLLTPIFEFVRVSPAGRPVITAKRLIGPKSLKNGQFLLGDLGNYRYTFFDRDGVKRQVKLPSHLCRVDSAEALRFMPLQGDFVRHASDIARASRRDRSVAGSSGTTQPPQTPSTSDSAPFPLPPAGSYENDPFRSWLVRTLEASWRRCCCGRTKDAIPPVRATSPDDDDGDNEQDPDDDQSDDEDEMVQDSDPSSESPTY